MTKELVEEIIEAVPVSELLDDLSRAELIKSIHLNVAYVFRGDVCQSLLKEVGRLREICSRQIEHGTGKSIDVEPCEYFMTQDLNDEIKDGPMQFIIWDRSKQKIIAGFRFIPHEDYVIVIDKKFTLPGERIDWEWVFGELNVVKDDDSGLETYIAPALFR
jgi:hypothetical protein